MATKKKAAKPAAPKKPVQKKKVKPAAYSGDLQAWERGEAIECSADTSK